MASTSRERVLAALEHRQPDRVPIDFGGHRSSGIMAIAYRKLRDYLGLPKKPIRVYDVIQQLAIVDEDVLDRFHIDAIEMGRGFAQEDRFWKEWRLPDGTECVVPSWTDVRREGQSWALYSASGRKVGVQPPGCLYFEQCHWPYAGGVPVDLSKLPDAMGEVMWGCIASPPEPGANLAAGAKALRARTDRAIIALFGGNLMEWGQFLCRNDNFYMLLAGDPDRAEALLDRLVELHLSNLERFLGAVGPHVDIVLFGDDLGMQTGPQISPQMYHELFFPRHRRMWKRAKELAKVKVMLHCCGGVRELLDDLIEAGLDTINPVQISCSGMSAAELKRDFGRRIAFWGGGCDTRAVLNQSTPPQVREHVLRQLDALSPGGGFVFQQVHNIMADVPPQNIVAMFDAVMEFGGK